MKKEEILNASRKEHRNKDLAEMEVAYQAGCHASRVGALVCCLLSLLSSVLAHTMIYSPWVIYFSIIATQWLVRFIKMKRKSDLVLTVLFFVLSILAFVGFDSLENLSKIGQNQSFYAHLCLARFDSDISQLYPPYTNRKVIHLFYPQSGYIRIKFPSRAKNDQCS